MSGFTEKYKYVNGGQEQEEKKNYLYTKDDINTGYTVPTNTKNFKTIANTVANTAANTTLAAVEKVNDLSKTIQENIVNQASFDPNVLDAIQGRLDTIEQRISTLEHSQSVQPSENKQEASEAEEKEEEAVEETQSDNTCPSGYTKFGNDAPMETVVKSGVDALVVTLSSDTIELDTMLDFIFNYAERVLSNCGVKKGEVGLTTIPKIIQTLPVELQAELLKDATALTSIMNDETLKSLVDKLKCIKTDNIKTKYEDFKNQLKPNLKSATSKIVAEIKTYLASGVSALASITETATGGVDKYADPIIDQVVEYAKPVFAVLDPIIEELDSKKDIDIESIKSIIQSKLKVNNAKQGGRKTYKKGYKKRRITKRKGGKTHKRRIMKKRVTKRKGGKKCV